MATVIKKTILYQLLFVICVAVPYINKYELTFAVWSFAAVITLQKKYSLSIIKQLGCYTAIVLISAIVMLFKDHEKYYIIRDFTYIVKPVLGLLIGYQLCRIFPQKAFQTIVHTAFFLALIHFWLIFLGFVVYRATSVNDIRFFAGYFSDYEVYALIILFFHKKFELGFTQKRTILYTVVIAISAFLYLSRTNFIQFFILFFALKGYYEINKRLIVVLVSLTLISIIGYSAILYINPKRNGPGMEAFLYKIKVAPIEPFKTKINRNDWRDFNDNYRSYENIMTARQVTRDGNYSTIFGQGLGSKVDLKQKIWLGDIELRYISILHNGFMTVFLKSGLAGLFFLLLSIFLLFKKTRSDIPIVQQINFMMVGTGLFMFVSCWVFMGFYFIADTKSILIGFIMCYREIINQQERKSIQND